MRKTLIICALLLCALFYVNANACAENIIQINPKQWVNANKIIAITKDASDEVYIILDTETGTQRFHSTYMVEDLINAIHKSSK